MSELVAPLIVLFLLLAVGVVVGVVLLRRRRVARGRATGTTPARTTGRTTPGPRLRKVPRLQADRGKDLARRPEQLGIRPLTEAERTRYRAAWEGVRSRSEHLPALALSEADAVLERMLRDCGYPIDDPRSPTDVVPGWHATVLASFRAGHELEQLNTTTRSDAEQVRQGMQHFGCAFAAVIGDGTPGYPQAPSVLRSDRSASPRSQPGR